MLMIPSHSTNAELLNSRVLQLYEATPMQEKKLQVILSILWLTEHMLWKMNGFDAKIKWKITYSWKFGDVVYIKKTMTKKNQYCLILFSGNVNYISLHGQNTSFISEEN